MEPLFWAIVLIGLGIFSASVKSPSSKVKSFRLFVSGMMIGMGSMAVVFLIIDSF